MKLVDALAITLREWGVGYVFCVSGATIDLAPGEPLVTAYAYKHDLHAMRGLLYAAGWRVRHVFTAEEQPMRLWLCEPRGG